MKVPRTITKPTYVLGLPQSDFRLLLAYFILGFVLNNLIQTFGIPVKFWGLLFIGISTWVLFIYLRYGARQNYPGFLSSSLSYMWLQGKQISVNKYRIEIRHK
jgi:hypothetical protein